MSNDLTVTFSQRISKYIGRDVVVEDQFPVPTGQATPDGFQLCVFSPIKGKLVAVYADGFALVMDGYREPREFVSRNVRSVMPIPLGGGLLLPQSDLKTSA